MQQQLVAKARALLATAQLTTAGTAIYKFRPGIGSHSYQAVFIGTHSYAKSTSTTPDLAVTGLYPTTTAIAASGLIGNYTLTATVVGAGRPSLSPTGNVSFFDTTNNDASLGTAALGTATPGQTFTTLSSGGSRGAEGVGDFNGDGILDMATVDWSDDTVTVLLGNGDGTFTKKSTISADLVPNFFAVGDFNGDGILDLATSNCVSPACGSSDPTATVTVLLGKGDGTFSAKTTP